MERIKEIEKAKSKNKEKERKRLGKSKGAGSRFGDFIKKIMPSISQISKQDIKQQQNDLGNELPMFENKRQLEELSNKYDDEEKKTLNDDDLRDLHSIG